jgi:hypothetical protein
LNRSTKARITKALMWGLPFILVISPVLAIVALQATVGISDVDMEWVAAIVGTNTYAGAFFLTLIGLVYALYVALVPSEEEKSNMRWIEADMPKSKVVMSKLSRRKRLMRWYRRVSRSLEKRRVANIPLPVVYLIILFPVVVIAINYRPELKQRMTQVSNLVTHIITAH